MGAGDPRLSHELIPWFPVTVQFDRWVLKRGIGLHLGITCITFSEGVPVVIKPENRNQDQNRSVGFVGWYAYWTGLGWR